MTQNEKDKWMELYLKSMGKLDFNSNPLVALKWITSELPNIFEKIWESGKVQGFEEGKKAKIDQIIKLN